MVDFSGIQETIDQVGFFSIPKLVFFTSHKPVFNLGAFFKPLRLFFWFLQQRQLARQLLCVPEHLDVTLKWRNFRAHLPWMDFPVQFPDVLDACH